MLIDGIVLTDESEVANLQVVTGPTFPTIPGIGELFYKTSVTAGLYVYSGAGWVAAQGGIVNEGSISHLNILDVGTNSHAVIDSHLISSTLHFTENSISHANIQDTGISTHDQIDTHLANTAIHVDKSVGVSITDTTPGNLTDKLVAGGNIVLSINNPGANETLIIGTSGNVGEANTISNVGLGAGLFKQKTALDLELKSITVSTKMILVDNIDTIDLTVNEAFLMHDSIGGAGINTHGQIDSHIATSSVHFTQTSIDHTNILNAGSNTHTQIDTHIADNTTHFTQTSIDHTNILNAGSNTHSQIDSHIANSALHTDENSKVSIGDTTPSSLENKIVAGINVSITKLNPGANEQLQINATAGGGGNVTVSTLSPTGGSDGDVWYKI